MQTEGIVMSVMVTKDTQIKRARLYPDVIHLHLDEAKLCANCDTIHSGSSCPMCTSTHWFLLSSVMGRMSESLETKLHIASLHRVANDSRTGYKITTVPKNEKGASLKFLLLHLTTWLR